MLTVDDRLERYGRRALLNLSGRAIVPNRSVRTDAKVRNSP
ncbi:hypothetical protein CKA32_005461 [Geitlerinema sp. FC II]|nr:hypothetical protein [Baaleninema simplex]MDC0835011.1 hypothetical protein [Geitlerinema sp. CS-897]PPT08579.1 hypothetical protein CKA32_005461 [Geitlerinema sp. FC II]